jgi:hypothetical protein
VTVPEVPPVQSVCSRLSEALALRCGDGDMAVWKSPRFAASDREAG